MDDHDDHDDDDEEEDDDDDLRNGRLDPDETFWSFTMVCQNLLWIPWGMEEFSVGNEFSQQFGHQKSPGNKITGK